MSSAEKSKVNSAIEEVSNSADSGAVFYRDPYNADRILKIEDGSMWDEELVCAASGEMIKGVDAQEESENIWDYLKRHFRDREDEAGNTYTRQQITEWSVAAITNVEPCYMAPDSDGDGDGDGDDGDDGDSGPDLRTEFPSHKYHCVECEKSWIVINEKMCADSTYRDDSEGVDTTKISSAEVGNLKEMFNDELGNVFNGPPCN